MHASTRILVVFILLLPRLAYSSLVAGDASHLGTPSNGQASIKWYAPIPGLSEGHEARVQSFLKGPVALASDNDAPSIFSKTYSNRVTLAWGAPLPVPSDADTSWPPASAEGSVPPSISVSPTVVDDTYRGLVEFEMTGLAAGQRVILEKYRVFDASVGIEADSILMGSYVLQDGYFPLVGEVYNFNIPGDTDEVDGSISAQLDLFEPDISSTVGDYVYRVKSPTGAYAPVDTAFRINAELSDQSFFGLILDPEGNAVPNAFVAVLNPIGSDNTFVYGETSDSSGFYDLYTAPDTEYDLVAAAPGYVGPYGKNVSRYILEGEDIYEDIILTPGTQTIGGRVHEAGDFARGLPGVEMIFLSVGADNEIDQNLFTATWTDANGDYEVDVTEGRWIGLVRQNIAYRFGYMGSGVGGAPADTTTGSVSNYNIGLIRGESVLQGNLTSSELDLEGNEVGIEGVTISAVRESDGLPAHGVTDLAGSYRIALGEGRWNVYAMPNPLADRDYSPSIRRDVVIGSEPSSLEYNFTARPIDAYVSGFLKDEIGDGVPKLFLRAIQLIDRAEAELGARNTDETDGFFQFSLSAGDWLIMPDPAESARRQLLFGSLPEVSVKSKLEGEATPVLDADFQTYAPTGEIVLTLVNSTGNPIPGVIVHAKTTIGKDEYNTFGESDSNGEARLAVIDGEWHVDLSGPSLNKIGFAEAPRFAINVIWDASLTVPLEAFSNDTPGLEPVVEIAAGTSEKTVNFEGSGEGGRRYVIEGSEDLINWRELGRVYAKDGGFSLLPDALTQALDKFFLRLRLDQ